MKKTLLLIAFLSLITSSAWADRYASNHRDYGYRNYNMHKNYPHYSYGNKYRHQAKPYHHYDKRPTHHATRLKIGNLKINFR